MDNYPTAIDLFAGAGGATQGLRDAGFQVLGAVEIDKTAAESYRLNHPNVRLWEADIRKLHASKVRAALGLESGELTLLKACPPCQGFSTLAEGRLAGNDPRNDLVGHTVRFVRALRPRSVLVENVPGLGRDRRSRELMEALVTMGYATRSYIVDATNFGVPQRRKRFIILAIRGRRSALPARLDAGDLHSPRTVRQAFDDLEMSVGHADPLHVERPNSSELVRRRIAAVPVGGNRFDLPEELQLECHKRLEAQAKRSAAGSYGRLRWEEPAPTMTTRCTTPACGSFIHPSLNRAITLREAATIQTFPVNYRFAGGHGEIERQIGNAVPVKMARGIAESLRKAMSVS